MHKCAYQDKARDFLLERRGKDFHGKHQNLNPRSNHTSLDLRFCFVFSMPLRDQTDLEAVRPELRRIKTQCPFENLYLGVLILLRLVFKIR